MIPSRTFVIVMNRYLSLTAREGNRQFSGRVHFSQQDIHRRGCSHAARVPGIQQGIGMGKDAGEGDRTTGEHQYRQRLSIPATA